MGYHPVLQVSWLQVSRFVVWNLATHFVRWDVSMVQSSQRWPCIQLSTFCKHHWNQWDYRKLGTAPVNAVLNWFYFLWANGLYCSLMVFPFQLHSSSSLILPPREASFGRNRQEGFLLVLGWVHEVAARGCWAIDGSEFLSLLGQRLNASAIIWNIQLRQKPGWID